ncbi:MAG: OmpA family protein [Thalassobaculaceae bacterium]
MTSIAALLLLAGCSSVPDALNPVEWYEGTTDTVGGWFSDDEPATADGGTATGSATGSGDFPNLASVPQRPTPSTTAEERAQIQQGLIADRNNARYTDSADASAPADPPRRASTAQPAAPRSTATSSTAAIGAPAAAAESAARTAAADASIPAPQPSAPAPSATRPEQTAAVPPPVPERQAPAAAPATGDGSTLWPRRPAPEPESRSPMTSGRVPDAESRVVRAPDTQTSGGRRPLAETLTRADTRNAETRLDSAGTDGVRTSPRTEPAGSAPAAQSSGPEISRRLISETRTQRMTDGTVRTETTAPQPETVAAVPDTMTRPAQTASAGAGSADAGAAGAGASDESASVIVDGPSLDQYQLGFSGPAYLVGTVNFRHGSSGLSADDLDMVRSIASAARETDAYIRVIGHASARTAEMDLPRHELVNFEQSLARAEAVARALTQAGVPAERVLVEAMSASQPLYFESMPSGEAGNRRAEILFQY